MAKKSKVKEVSFKKMISDSVDKVTQSKVGHWVKDVISEITPPLGYFWAYGISIILMLKIAKELLLPL